MINKECVLYENKICDYCGDCNYCDINPDKICDNCCKCINENNAEYRAIEIEDILDMKDDNNQYTFNQNYNNHHDCCCGDCEHEK